MRRTAIDLFCGCGGFSDGLRRAGFKILAGVDMNDSALASYTLNFPEAKSIRLDLSEMHPNKFMRLIGLKSGQLDCLVGGPPCQGFSKNTPLKNRDVKSKNNMLIKTFLDYVEVLSPKSVILENVAEMKSGFGSMYSQEIQRRFTAAGYTVIIQTLNTVDYGVPQRRRRVLFLASKLGVVNIPATCNKAVKVWEAIGDLPSYKHNDTVGQEAQKYACPPFTSYQRAMRKGVKCIRNCQPRALSLVQYRRLSSLEPGQGLMDLPADIRPNSGYSGAYGRLTKDMTAPTITRWFFHTGSGRFGHPVDIRTITIREAARLQGFYDDFEFCGTYTQQASQVGNAIPPILAEALGKHISKFIGRK